MYRSLVYCFIVFAAAISWADVKEEEPLLVDLSLSNRAKPQIDVAPRSKNRQGYAKAEVTLISESFEGDWPIAPWIINHKEGYADVDWARTTYRASVGTHSIYCAGRGLDAPDEGGTVPVNTASWAIVGPYDLTEATSATLSFDLWLRTEHFHDHFMWLASTDGENFSGAARSTDTSDWQSITADLTEWPNLGDITGQAHIWIAFVYASDHSGEFEGAYVDNVELIADNGVQVSISRTYTSDDDFNSGSTLGLTIESGELQLSDVWTTYPYIWIANTETGTVSKVSTDLANIGAELARYYTGPERELEPSTIAVDLDGNCWVANRAAGTAVKIALSENDDCVDRNNNGQIDTSTDTDEDNNITGDELLDWGEDECVIHEIVLVDGKERSYTPGEEHEDYADTDLRALAIDADNNLWAGTADSMSFFKINNQSAAISEPIDVSENETQPFDVIIGRDGLLWSSAWPEPWLLLVDPGSLVQETIDLEHASYDVVVNDLNQLYVTGYEDAQMSRVNTTTSEVEEPYTVSWQAGGSAVAHNRDLWVASAGVGSVQRISSAGLIRAGLRYANGPTGVAVDANGLIWITGALNENILIVDPSNNVTRLLRVLVDSGSHDGIGDMTGISVRNHTVSHGSWQTIFDSEFENTPWGTISWNSEEPEGSRIIADVRSSNDQLTWSTWERATKGEDLIATPAGRYLAIKAALQNSSAETSPILEDITIQSALLIDPPEAGFSWSPTYPAIDEAVTFSNESTQDPESWSWDFGDGATSTDINPTHVYSQAGAFTITLEVSNEAGSDTEEKTISVGAGTAPRRGSRRIP